MNPIVIEGEGIGEVEGRFHYHRQNFWIEALPQGNGVSVNKYQLAASEIVPPANETCIQIGEITFKCHVDP